MNLKHIFPALAYTGASVLACVMASCGSNYNGVNDPHFTEYGELVADTASAQTKPFAIEEPAMVSYYVEVSGSMNGFFRANRPTQFKTDLWQVISQTTAGDINILTDDGSAGAAIPQPAFQTMMNTGAFQSSASTKLPLMMQAVMSNLRADSGEVAVLVSDMKYSPVGAAAPQVLLEQYSSDINRIVGSSHLAFCLIGATSDYIDKTGNAVTDSSPYYYLVIGPQGKVAYMRNCISALLSMQGHFVDNIESGFDYGAPKYSFGIPNKCSQIEDYPAFCDYEDEEDGDTCTIRLRAQLEDYRWLMADSAYVREALKVKTLYGSKITVGNIKVETQDIDPQQKKVKRTATATIDLKVSYMPQDADVIEWTFELPDTDYTKFARFFDNATDEADPAKSYSVLNFMKGIFQGGTVNSVLDKNYILVSREN